MNNPNAKSTRVNPAASSEVISATRLPLVDYLVTGPNAESMIPAEAHFREEARAVNLGHAAGHVVVGEALRDEIRAPLAAHLGAEARREAAEPRRRTARQIHAAAADVVLALRAVPLNDVDPVRRWSANGAKVLLIIGDTCVLANQVYRAATPIWLAIPLGLSLATSVVAIGSKCGHEIATDHQRRDRGRAPERAPSIVRPYYDDGAAEERFRIWQRLCFIAAGAMFFSLYFMGSGSGDPAVLAAGYGLLGALTVAGSAGAEAYAANDAAEQRERAEVRLTRSSVQLREFEDLEQRSAHQLSEATALETAAHHRGVAIAATVTATANRLPDTPEIGGYLEAGHIPMAVPPPTPITPLVSSITNRRRTQPGDVQSESRIPEIHTTPNAEVDLNSTGPPWWDAGARNGPEFETTDASIKGSEGHP